jgi:regulator of protease activity HflC (stomatin/prohibitin superfamily)
MPETGAMSHSRRGSRVVILAASLALGGCMSQDVPQAHRGRIFDRTGALALYTGGAGFVGSVLGPGTYWTGLYDQIRMVDCSMTTVKESLQALTKDGVQFGLDIYIRYGAECDDGSVAAVLGVLAPDDDLSVSREALYQTFVRPAIGEAARETVSPHRAIDINDKREEILAHLRERFLELMSREESRVIKIYEVNLSNLVFPQEMVTANTERAVQAVLRDRAIAERERVEAEIKTTEMRRELSERQGDVEAARIDRVGAALGRNPSFLQYDLQSRMPEIYKAAGEKGNMVITAPSPTLMLPPRSGG